jgi:hypothetical protein
MGLFIASSAIGAGAVAIALTFRPPRAMSLMLPSQRHRSLTTAELIRVK